MSTFKDLLSGRWKKCILPNLVKCTQLCKHTTLPRFEDLCLPALTTLVTGHGNIKSYLHRFRIIEAPDFPCGNGNQTAEHILLECGILREERERLIAAAVKTQLDHKKDMLIKKHYKAFAEFTKTMDKVKELNTL